MGCANSNQQNAHVCCPPGSWPALQIDYSPKGKIIDINGIKVYQIGTGKKFLIIFEDIFGIENGRHKTVADTYAQQGFRVLLPQFLDPPYSGSIEDIPKLLQCVQKQKISTIKARYEEVTTTPVILATGFCWGAWTAFRMSADYSNIKAIAAIHPSLNVENFYGGKQVPLVESVKCPVFFYSCSNDMPGTKKGGEFVKILATKFGEDKTGSQEFPDQIHGFMLRADPTLQSAKRDTERIIQHSLQYFAKFD